MGIERFCEECDLRGDFHCIVSIFFRLGVWSSLITWGWLGHSFWGIYDTLHYIPHCEIEYYGVLSTFIWNDTLGRPRGVISAITVLSTPRLERTPRIRPHGNHKNYR